MDDLGDERDLQVLSREELEATVRRRTAELRDVMDTMADVLLTLDPDGRIEMANAAVETLLGYDPEALEGRRLDYLLATGGGKLVEAFPGAELVERLVADGEIRELEVLFGTADGGRVPMQLSASVMREEGSVSGYVCVAKDITERKRRERELRRQNEYLDAFASVVSHDIETPLGTVENEARVVEMTGDVEHVEGIFEAAERIREMTDELLALARRGQGVGETEPVDLASVVREAWEAVDPDDATLSVDVDDTVEASPDRLRQLLVNLFRNAVEHGGDGVAVTVGAVERGFYVADDGPGLPADVEDPDDVFEEGVTTDEAGTGLGLAIVRRIAEGHGWSVAATDSAAGGARFEVHTDGGGHDTGLWLDDRGGSER